MKRIAFYLVAAICFPTANVCAQQQFSLKDCLGIGLENNYAIRISRNEEQIDNDAMLANAGFFPTLDLTAGYNGSVDNTKTIERATQNRQKSTGVFDQTFNAGLSLNWTIFDGFKIITNYKRLKELQRQGETNTRITIEDFIANLTAEYYNYVQQTVRLKNFRYAVSLSKERLRIVEERYNIGSFSKLDLQQARVYFNADSSQYMKQQELLNTSRIRLNELMARRDLDMKLVIADSVIVPNVNLSFDELWNSTLLTNSTLLKAEQERTLAALDLKTVNARDYPYVRLNSGYGYTLNKYEVASSKRRENLGLNFGVTVGFRLFDGNRKRERTNANIAIENARLTRQQLEQSLQADINSLWQAYRNNINILRLERENLAAAQENHDIAMERYLLGDLSGIEMREAQKSLLDAEERILSAEYDTKVCEISLLQISGKVTDYLD
jgi:outer membrane protein TolC